MPPLRDDTEPAKAEPRLEAISGELSFRELVGTDNRMKIWLATNVGALVVSMFALKQLIELALQNATSAALVDTGGYLALAALLVMLGLTAADTLGCVSFSGHECRHCRAESERWEAETE